MKVITFEQWQKHPSYRQDLTALLENPVLQMAIQMVMKAAMLPVAAAPGENLIHFNAILGAKREGLFETLNFLQMLTKAPQSRDPEKKPWTTPPPNKAP